MRLPKPFLLLPITALLPCFLSSTAAQAETLADIFALAQKNDAIIRAQEANLKAGQETSTLARSALLPQVNLGLTHSEGKIKDNNASASFDTSTDSATLTASQTLFNMEYWYNYQSGKKAKDRAEAEFRTQQQDLVVRVTKAYTDVLSAIDAYNSAKVQELAIGRQLEQTKQRFDVGLVAITDVYESQASFDDAHVATLSAKGGVGIAFEALDNITGTAINSIAPLSPDYVTGKPDPADRDAWVTQALANNTDLQASQLAKEAARENAEAKRAGHYPTVMASYQHGENKTDASPASPAFDADRSTDVISISVNVPLYSGGGTSASQRQAWSQYNAADEQWLYVQRATVQAARSYYLAVTTGSARVEAQKQAIVSAQSALDATKAGYEAGTRNIVDVLNAERALHGAEYLWATARYQYITDTLSLRKVAGALTPQTVQDLSSFLLADQTIARRDFDN